MKNRKKLTKKSAFIAAINNCKSERDLLINQRKELQESRSANNDDLTLEQMNDYKKQLEDLDKDIAEARSDLDYYTSEFNDFEEKARDINGDMSGEGSYLRSDEAMQDFFKILATANTEEEAQTKWNSHVSKRGIDYDSNATAPTQIGEIFDNYAKTYGTIYSNVSFVTVENTFKQPYETLQEGARGDNRTDKIATRKTAQSSKIDFVVITVQDIYKLVDLTKKDLRDFKQLENWTRTELPKRYFFTIEQAITIGGAWSDTEDAESKITSFVAMHDASDTFATAIPFTAYDENTLDNLARKVKTDGIKVIIGNEEDYYDLKAVKQSINGLKAYDIGTAQYGDRTFNTVGGFVFIPKTFMPITSELVTGAKGLIMADLKGYMRCVQDSMKTYTDNSMSFNYKSLMVEGAEGGAPYVPKSIAYLQKGGA